MDFPSDSHAFGFCDRCYFRYQLESLREEVVNGRRTGLRVCRVCFDQETLQNVKKVISFDHNSALVGAVPDQALESSRELETDIVAFSAGDVNRISSESSGSGHYSDLFKTLRFSFIGPEIYTKTLVYTSTKEINEVCDSVIPGSEFPLEFTSAKLSVGAFGFGNTYTNIGSSSNNVHSVLVDYDVSSVTWNSFGYGGDPGVDYDASPISSGTVGSYYIEWDLTDLVDSWVNEGASNKGLFFPDMGTSVLGTSTATANVRWNIVARRVIR